MNISKVNRVRAQLHDGRFPMRRAIDVTVDRLMEELPVDCTESDEERMGRALAEWAEWDGALLLRLAGHALEDANFHREAEVVRQMEAALFHNADDCEEVPCAR